MPDPRETPAMQQYYRFKKRYEGCILLFRIGDFYEMFDDDAVTVSKAIGLTLTQRTAGVPMAGMPFHQLETYLRKLTLKGFRVAVCEQLMEASAVKGLVPRAVTRVITPGTLVDESLLETDQRVAVAAIVPADAKNTTAPARVALATVDVSTGDFFVSECVTTSAIDELSRRGVRELLYIDTAERTAPAYVRDAASPLNIATLPRAAWHFRPQEALDTLLTHFAVKTLAGFGLKDNEPAVLAAGALLRYVQETQTAGDDESREVAAAGVTIRRGSLAHVRAPKRTDTARHLLIDAVSLRSLEVERTMRDVVMGGSAASKGGDGTLMGIFQLAPQGQGSCRTPMGRRALREWLCMPLCERAAVEHRQTAVASLVADRTLAEQIGGVLAEIQDIARIAGRVSLARATPRDIVALARSVQASTQLARVIADAPALASLRQTLEGAARELGDLPADIARLCVDEPPAHMRDGGLIRDGVDAELDEARLLERDAGSWLAAYQTRLIAEHSLPSLKVGYNKVAGYFIELPMAQAATAPVQLKRMQTLRNAERFTTPELSDFERKVTTAQARAQEREKQLFQELCDRALQHTAALATIADNVATLDATLALADKAHHRGWVRPALTDAPGLAIAQGRHPVLEEALIGSGGSCVANDTGLGGEAAALALLTGPNMAGKSTYIRQVALLTLLAHAGSFVPATSATVGMVDRIFTRIGADDALHAGQSTFMVEMIETANILHHATGKSLVILDEVGRGTSTLDGLSLAWAIVEYLAKRDDAPRTLFATHYHELTDLEERLPGKVQNLHVAVREWPQGGDHAEIVFLHRILPGKTDRSYGLHVARLAGMPKDVVSRANDVLKSLAVHTGAEAGAAKSKRRVDTSRVSSSAEMQMPLFKEYVPHPAVDALRDVKLEELTPMKAFDTLRELREMVDDQPAASSQ